MSHYPFLVLSAVMLLAGCSASKFSRECAFGAQTADGARECALRNFGRAGAEHLDALKTCGKCDHVLVPTEDWQFCALLCNSPFLSLGSRPLAPARVSECDMAGER